MTHADGLAAMTQFFGFLLLKPQHHGVLPGPLHDTVHHEHSIEPGHRRCAIDLDIAVRHCGQTHRFNTFTYSTPHMVP